MVADAGSGNEVLKCRCRAAIIERGDIDGNYLIPFSRPPTDTSSPWGDACSEAEVRPDCGRDAGIGHLQHGMISKAWDQRTWNHGLRRRRMFWDKTQPLLILLMWPVESW